MIISYDALLGQEALIITMKTTAPKLVQEALIEGAAAADVSFVIPNDWGLDPANPALGTYTSCFSHTVDLSISKTHAFRLLESRIN